MPPHFIAHILYILNAIDKLEHAVEKGESYYRDPMVYNGMLHFLQTLSESACKLPETIKEMHPNVPWRSFGISRNALSHDYLGNIFQEDIVQTVKQALPLLKEAMLQHAPNWQELWQDYWDD